MELIDAYIKHSVSDPYQFMQLIEHLIQVEYEKTKIRSKKDLFELERYLEKMLTECFDYLLKEEYFFQIEYNPYAYEKSEFEWCVVDQYGITKNVFDFFRAEPIESKGPKYQYQGVYISTTDDVIYY